MKHYNRISMRGISVFKVLLVLMLVATLICGCTPKDSQQQTAQTIDKKVASSEDLYCLEFISYSGPYVEDGSNEMVENVLAILVENRSDEFLELATITYDVGIETATFVLSSLPKGEKAWVLEKNRMKVNEGVDFEFSDCQSNFRSDAIETTDKLQLDIKKNTLTVKNVSNEVLRNPCVYYKNLNSDGNYLGGITYMIGFDEIMPGDSLKKKAGHYAENSRIVRYSYQTE